MLFRSVNDYFKTEDVRKHGLEVWNRIREMVRESGYSVSENFGRFEDADASSEFIELYADGDLVHTKMPSGRGQLISIADIVDVENPKAAMKPLKIRCNDPIKLGLALDYLVERGFSDEYREATIAAVTKPMFVGVIGESDGCIYYITRENSFNEKHKDVEELQFDVETTHKIANAKFIAPELIVEGYVVNRIELEKFLKQNGKSIAPTEA